MLVHKRYKLPERCNVAEVLMRETNGIDEQRAAMQADARGDRSSVYLELIRLSIVEVDGMPVAQPYNAMEEWTSRTRAFIRAFYEDLNDVQTEEVAASRAAGEAVAVPSARKEAQP